MSKLEIKNPAQVVFILLCISFPFTDFVNAVYQHGGAVVQGGDITPGVIVRGSILLFSGLLYLYFLSKKISKTEVLTLIGLGGLACIFLFQSLMRQSLPFLNIYDLSKLVFPFVIFSVLIASLRQRWIDKNVIKKGLWIAGFLYVFNIVGAFIFDYGYATYGKYEAGIIGFMISQNSYSMLLILFLSFGIHEVVQNKLNLNRILFVVLVICSMGLLQTRAALGGIVAAPLTYFVLWLGYKINFRKLKIKLSLKTIAIVFIFLLIGLVALGSFITFGQNTHTYKKLERSVKRVKNVVVNREPLITSINFRDIFTLRAPSVKAARVAWSRYDYSEYLLGTGVERASLLVAQIGPWEGERKYVEVDHWDLALRYGYLGTIIYFYLWGILLFQPMKNFYLNWNSETILVLTVCLLLLAHAFLAGHLFWTPWLMFFVILICVLSRELNEKRIK